jgi:endonuclease G
VGLFLHFGGKSKPVVAFWDSLKTAIWDSTENSNNPYKAPEPYADTVAIDTGPSMDIANETKFKPEDIQSTTKKDTGIEENVSDEELSQIVNQSDFFLPGYGSNDQLVRRVGYSLKYIEQYELPAWVAYILQSDQIGGGEERENEFMPDPVIRTGTATTSDYTKSGFDRGHLAPAADFKNSYQVMKETFYMSNICPQEPQFNRGIWLDLEKMVRVWAVKYDKVYVVTGPVLKEGLTTIGRVNKIAVPEQFYKVVLYVKPPYVKGIAFLMENKPSEAPLSRFVVSIDQVERLTGIDFFPRLPDSIERKVEARSNVKEWYRLN